MREVLVFSSHYQPYELWRATIERQMPDIDVLLEEHIDDPARVKYALVSRPRDRFFDTFPELRFIINMGAGVDALLSRTDLPSIPVTRITDDGMSNLMSQYVRLATLRYARDFHEFEQAQRERRWITSWPREAHEVKVGVLGLGELGTRVAAALAADGYEVKGWSRSAKTLPGVMTFFGEAQLAEFLFDIEILVILLPLTPATEGFVNSRFLAMLPKGAKIINAARGAVVDEAALVTMLQRGHIGGATLDTFVQEPLPPDHAFWSLPNVVVTPHIAARPVAASAALEIVQNVQRSRDGQQLLNVVGDTYGYSRPSEWSQQ